MKFSTLFSLFALVLTLGLAAPATAQEGYQVRAGDVLRIEVIEDSSLNRSVLVAPDGSINVPLAGAIRARGRTLQSIQTDLANALAPNFATTPSVFVALERQVQRQPSIPQPPRPEPTIAIFTLGEVGSAGRIDVAEGTTVLQLFAQMGGFSRFAATSRIQLRRTENGQETIYTIDYRAIEEGRSDAGSLRLREGDVIVVPQRRLFE